MRFIKILPFLLPFLFFSCLSENSDNACYEITGMPTTSVDGPIETTVGEPIELVVTYNVANDCDSFYLFFEEELDGAKYVTVNVRYDGCACPPITRTRTKTYEFVSSETGTFSLRFKVTNSTYIEHIIEVAE
jgi:hypothetical protein